MFYTGTLNLKVRWISSNEFLKKSQHNHIMKDPLKESIQKCTFYQNWEIFLQPVTIPLYTQRSGEWVMSREKSRMHQSWGFHPLILPMALYYVYHLPPCHFSLLWRKSVISFKTAYHKGFNHVRMISEQK